ncbi:hypothetical protein [Oceanicella sp. SM1341]|uniref:hypothetical protein n=1 Tax=Oceanicella sp. SM1341 TaxID=1548889 RepID=UPI000E509180|nr:hypothetical protein [Oceanicella sp. SM1341]
MIGISRDCLTRPADQRLVLVEDFRRRKSKADQIDLLETLRCDGEARLERVAGWLRLSILGLEVHAMDEHGALRRWCILASRRVA